jgi:hypothetical protein
MGLIHTTANGVQIFAEPGKKSINDFIVKFRLPGGRLRVPRHIHLIVEMYVKHAHDPILTMQLRNHFLGLFGQISPATQFPPSLSSLDQAKSNRFNDSTPSGSLLSNFSSSCQS